jgi:acyl phosphate:glycerol-3-phosphate acyltransferase
MIMLMLILLTLAYCLGSVSCAILVTKLMDMADPRTLGSGNAGATNMLRLAGKKVAAIVLLGDFAKGAIATWIGLIAGQQGFSLGLIMVAVVVGHIFPVFFNFKGGKGVATALGAIVASSPIVGLLCVVIWLLVALATRYASLASIIAIAAAPVFYLLVGKSSLCIPGIIIAAIVAIKHKENIKRLMSGVENKIRLR